MRNDGWELKTTQSAGTRLAPQTVAATFKFKLNGKAIARSVTDQQWSPHAGSALFWGWRRPLDWGQRLAGGLPHRRRSNHKLLPLEKALTCLHGWLGAARKLTHVAYLRRDLLVPELQVKRASRS